MKVLHLTLKKKWFDMIASGEKKEEYREIKPFWSKRFTLLPNDSPNLSNVTICSEHLWSSRYAVVKFVNGGNFHHSLPSLTFKLQDLTVDEGRPEWGAEPGKKYFVIRLGERIQWHKHLRYNGQTQHGTLPEVARRRKRSRNR